MRKREVIMIILSTVVAMLYSFLMRAVLNYRARSFNVYPLWILEIAYYLLLGLFVSIWFRQKDRGRVLPLLAVLVNAAIVYYLYTWNSITYGIEPIYNAILAGIFLFDCLWPKKE